MNSKTLQRIFTCVELFFLLGLLLAAALFVKDVVRNYMSNDTSIKISTLKENLSSPSITFCFQPMANYEFINSNGLTLSDFTSHNASNQDHLKESWASFYYQAAIKIGVDFIIELNLNDKNESYEIRSLTAKSDAFVLSEIFTAYFGICYKLNLTRKITRGNNEFKIIFKKFYHSAGKLDQIPWVEIYFTSEENAYGIIPSYWIDGDAYRLSINPTLLLSHYVDLLAFRYERLEINSGCQEESHMICVSKLMNTRMDERVIRSLDNKNFKDCLPSEFVSLIAMTSNNSHELCESPEDVKENYAFFEKLLRDVITECPKKCSVMQYNGKLGTRFGYLNEPTVSVSFRFKTDDIEIHQEFLVYDENELIGSIGGTLGLFIGFSFLDTLKNWFDKLKRFIISKGEN